VVSAPSQINIPGKWIAAGLIVAVAIMWIALTNAFSPKPIVVTATPARVNATPATTPTAPSTSMLMTCAGEAYKTRSGLIICGVTMVDQQYVWLQQGWIAPAGNMSAAFTLIGDTSSCQFQMAVNRLIVNCKSPIAVGR